MKYVSSFGAGDQASVAPPQFQIQIGNVIRSIDRGTTLDASATLDCVCSGSSACGCSGSGATNTLTPANVPSTVLGHASGEAPSYVPSETKYMRTLSAPQSFRTTARITGSATVVIQSSLSNNAPLAIESMPMLHSFAGIRTFGVATPIPASLGSMVDWADGGALPGFLASEAPRKRVHRASDPCGGDCSATGSSSVDIDIPNPMFGKDKKGQTYAGTPAENIDRVVNDFIAKINASVAGNGSPKIQALIAKMQLESLADAKATASGKCEGFPLCQCNGRNTSSELAIDWKPPSSPFKAKSITVTLTVRSTFEGTCGDWISVL